jgi:hypothetical protein
MNRPLPDDSLDYAKQDAYLIYSLYDHFSRAGYLSRVTEKQSMRYVSLHSHSPPRRGEIYGSHPLLPLGILGADPIEGLTKKCPMCNRTLSLFAFPPLKEGRRCFVCRAVDIRNESKRRRKQTMEAEIARVEDAARIGDQQVITAVTLRHGALADASQ